MIYIRGVTLHPSMARLATVENLCNVPPTSLIQKPKARARCSGLIAVCPESRVPNPDQTILFFCGIAMSLAPATRAQALREVPRIGHDPKNGAIHQHPLNSSKMLLLWHLSKVKS